jgi:protoporphyrin/coproporphyrin ferrochelatase
VPFRASSSAQAYKSIWTDQGSPLIHISREQKDALKGQLVEPVTIAMRYGNPSTREAFDELVSQNPDLEEVIAIPLYPHYAMSSYETAVVEAREIHQKNSYRFQLSFFKPFYNTEEYIHALSESMKPFLPEAYDQVLFSYHGIPERHIHKTDITRGHCLSSAGCCEIASPAHEFCYRHQCRETTRLVADRLNIPEEKRGFSFQSRLGRDPWLQPYTVVRLAELPKEGVKKLVIVCPAFVSDCLETLEEIAGEGREVFMQAGGESFVVIPCLNVHPLWIGALKKWISDYRKGSQEMVFKGIPQLDKRKFQKLEV